MKTVSRKCPLCGHGQADVLHSQHFILAEGHPLANGYDVVCCEQCGFVYADIAVPQAEYDRFYTQYSKYEDVITGTGGTENSWDRQRQEDTARQIHTYFNGAPISILDVGCANGGLLKALYDLGYENLLGLDPSPRCVENTRRLGLKAERGSLFHPFNHPPYDLVILSHTLEHLQDLELAAKQIRKMMKENSTVYVEVPDASRYVDFLDAPFQDFNTEHINHFSTLCLNNYLKRNGFEPKNWGSKVIPASADKLYPAIYCFAKPTQQSLPIEKDNELRKRIEIYIKRSQNILDEINARLNTILAQHKQLIVWGAGQLTLKLLAQTSLADAEIVVFVDSNPIHHGKILHGTKIVPPEAINGLDHPILIASTLHQQSILQQIRNMGLNNQIILLKD
jgi:SAM-dependent methyltransferase